MVGPNIFWAMIIVGILVAILIAVTISLVVGQSAKVATNSNTPFRRSLIVAVSFYLISVGLILGLLGPGWAIILGLRVFPFLSLVILLILELIQLFKEMSIYRKR
jgi:hypothetical protein